MRMLAIFLLETTGSDQIVALQIVMPIFRYDWRFSCNVKCKRVHFADDTELSLARNSWEDLGVSVNGVQK